MEELKVKYGFSEEQMNDIRELVLNSLKEIMPALIEESIPALAEKCKETIVNATNNNFHLLNKKTPPSREALHFIAINKQAWKLQLTERNKLYEQFIRCESLLDIYGLCMQEEPIYIPRRYRHDKVHVLYEEEKNIRTTANLQNMQADMAVLKIRRDNYKRMLDKCDDNSLKFIEQKVKDATTIPEITSIWKESIKQDQEKVNKTWAKKIASMHAAFEKDKESLSRQERGNQITSSTDDIDVSEIDSDDEDDDHDKNQEEAVAIPAPKHVRFTTGRRKATARGPRKNKQHVTPSVINRQSHQFNSIQRTIENDAFIPPTTVQASSGSTLPKNDQRHNQKDRGGANKVYPLRSLTFLDSLSHTVNSDC